MAITRSVLNARESSTLQFHYAKRDPSTGTYYDDTQITAATIKIYNSAGTELATGSMTYVANLRGYIFNWTYAAALDGLYTIYTFVQPTRAASVPAALAGDEIVPLDISDVDKEAASIKAKTDNLPANPAAVGSAMTLADGAITDAKFTVPSLTGPASGPVGYIYQVWRRFFKKATLSSSAGIKTYADDGTTVVTTQTVADDATTQTQGAAT